MSDGTSRATPPLRLLQVTAFVSTLDRFAMPPMLLAIAHDLGVPLSDVVHAAGAYFLVYGLSQPAWGMVSDRFGRVRTMRWTLLLAGIFAIVSALSWSPLALVLSRAVAGGLFGAAYPSSLIYLGDTVPASRRQRSIASLMVGVALGTALASAGAGVLADVATWRAAFVVTGVASVLLAWLLHRLPEPDRERPTGSVLAPVRRIVRSRMTLLVLLFAFAEGAVLLGVLTLLPPAVEGSGATAAVAGVVTGVYGVSVFVSSQLVGRLSQRWHPSRLIVLGGVAAVLASALLAVSQRPASAVVVAALLGLAWTSMHSSLQTWATEVLPGARATTVSFFAGSLFVGSALGAVLVAGLAEAGRYSLIFAIAATLAVPLALGAGAARRTWVRPPDEQAA
ncbi:MFS transporter [Nocardioides lijunqiniae]|uniref:MFS transporter n=1 Tax=Nocardioides lijunqiniae TaxID=2760832 RepID=UPI001D0C233E|nr:MFS transporter [Nocardioides lijunqiniae]